MRSRFVKNAILVLHLLECKILPRLISDEKAVCRSYKKKTGKYPDLDYPQKFSEKMQWYKLNSKEPLMEKCADKIDVRDYVAKCGYSEILNEVFGVYERPKDIPISKLPQEFVIKASHGSGWNLIVKDKKRINWRAENRTMSLWLKQNIYWSGREWVYKNLAHRLLVEKYLEDGSGGLLDYKFYCFNGVPKFLQVEVGRYTTQNTRNFYDMQWNLLPFGKGMPHNPNIDVPQPTCFEYMKKIAADLSAPFSYVRVDLYQVHGKVFFGELTFFPAGGTPDFVPEKYDRIVGDMWDITT